MRIKKLRLKNGYKRFHDLTIDLGDSPQKIIALVGPNGCGKSSVLDGIIYHSKRTYGAIGNKPDKNHTYHSMNSTPNFTGHVNVEIELTTGKYNDIARERKTVGSEKAMISFRSPYRYNSNLKVTKTSATVDIKLNQYGASTTSDLDDKMEENYRRLYAKFNKLFRELDLTFQQTMDKIVGDLNKSITACLDLEISDIGNIDDNKGSIYFKKSDHPSEFDFNVLSSGEKEIVDILLDLYLRADEYNDTIFLLDEPELHINTSIQKKLLKEIDRLIGENCQIWITTHSIGFLRALQSDLKDKTQIIQFSDDYELASKAETLVPMTTSRSNWQKLFSIALDDLTNLVSPREIIYCEGRDSPSVGGEERGFDAKVFNTIFASEFPETLFVSSGGNTELDQRSTIAIAIIGKALPDVKIRTLKDRDMASGKNTTEADRLEYLSNNPGSSVLKRWEIENYIYDKEVLKAYSTQQSREFDEKSYDDFISNIVDDDVKSLTGHIKKFCGVISNVNVETFKMNLAKCITPEMAVYAELKDCIFSEDT